MVLALETGQVEKFVNSVEIDLLIYTLSEWNSGMQAYAYVMNGLTSIKNVRSFDDYLFLRACLFDLFAGLACSVGFRQSGSTYGTPELYKRRSNAV